MNQADQDKLDAAAFRRLLSHLAYSEWKEKHQLPATPEQMAAFEARK